MVGLNFAIATLPFLSCLFSFSPFLLSSRALCHWHTATILQLNGGDGDNDNFCMDGDGAAALLQHCGGGAAGAVLTIRI